MGKALYPDAFNWLCGRCSTWNAIENGVCSHCHATTQATASAFRVKNVLTAEETVFYSHTAPQMAGDLRQIRNILTRMYLEGKDGKVHTGNCPEGSTRTTPKAQEEENKEK